MKVSVKLFAQGGRKGPAPETWKMIVTTSMADSFDARLQREGGFPLGRWIDAELTMLDPRRGKDNPRHGVIHAPGEKSRRSWSSRSSPAPSGHRTAIASPPWTRDMQSASRRAAPTPGRSSKVGRAWPRMGRGSPRGCLAEGLTSSWRAAATRCLRRWRRPSGGSPRTRSKCVGWSDFHPSRRQAMPDDTDNNAPAVDALTTSLVDAVKTARGRRSYGPRCQARADHAAGHARRPLAVKSAILGTFDPRERP